jgi:putative transcriptional regulator
MAIVRYKPGETPAVLSAPQRARLDAMTNEEIERNAVGDPDNPPTTERELALAKAARQVKRARAATGLSQAEFAKRFRINPARLRDWEQGRFAPDSAATAYLRVIEINPRAVEEALRQ